MRPARSVPTHAPRAWPAPTALGGRMRPARARAPRLAEAMLRRAPPGIADRPGPPATCPGGKHGNRRAGMAGLDRAARANPPAQATLGTKTARPADRRPVGTPTAAAPEGRSDPTAGRCATKRRAPTSMSTPARAGRHGRRRRGRTSERAWTTSRADVLPGRIDRGPSRRARPPGLPVRRTMPTPPPAAPAPARSHRLGPPDPRRAQRAAVLRLPRRGSRIARTNDATSR
jgi:hypothetical protein